MVGLVVAPAVHARLVAERGAADLAGAHPPTGSETDSASAPSLTPTRRPSETHSHPQVVPCSWQQGGPISMASDILLFV